MFQKIILTLSSCLLVAGCAASVQYEPAKISQSPAPSVLALESDIQIHLDSQYTRTLRQSSRWNEIGLLPQGRVLRPLEGVFTIEGRHAHEAYLVAANRTLVGFYLPAEQAYSALAKPVSIKLK